MLRNPPTHLDFRAGDAEFLDEDPRRRVQLRPLLKRECPRRATDPSDRLLVCRATDDLSPNLYAVVRLAPDERENTPVNVDRAISKLVASGVAVAQHFRAVFAAPETLQVSRPATSCFD